MQSTNNKRFKRQTIQLWLRNFPVLLLAFGLSGVIAIAASDPKCSAVELGAFGYVLNNFILGFPRINFILTVGGIIYLAIGFLFYFAGHKLKLRELQRAVYQPFVAPTLFIVAGYWLGIAAPLITKIEFGYALGVAVVILFLSTLTASIYEVCES